MGNPIVFIGYTSTPGDIVASEGPTYTQAQWSANSETFPDNIMPHLEANPVNFAPDSSDKGFVITHDYIELHNFMLSEYRVGIQVYSDYVTLDNIIGFQFGEWTPDTNCWEGGSAIGCTNANGYGIYSIGSSYLTITNSLIIDAGLASYFPTGSDNVTIEWCEAYSVNPGNGTDYLFDIYGTSNSIIRDCYAERTYNLPLTAHRSRALIFQAVSDNNLVERFSCKNVRIQIENSRNNILNDIYSEGSQGYVNSGGLQIYSESDDNLFVNWEMTGEGIQFLQPDFSEDNRGYVDSGNDNYLINFIIRDLPTFNGNAVVSFHRLDANAGTGGTNYIIGLTADNYPWIINANRPGTINFYNSSFSNGTQSTIDTFYSGYTDATGSYTANFINCNDYNNTFPAITGTNITTHNPLFTDIGSDDYTLQSGSSLNGIGVNMSGTKSEAAYDFSGNLRATPTSIGAFDNNDGGTPPTTGSSKRGRLPNGTKLSNGTIYIVQ